MLKNWSIIIHNESVNQKWFASYGLFFLAVISLTKINTSYLPWSQIATAYTGMWSERLQGTLLIIKPHNLEDTTSGYFGWEFLDLYYSFLVTGCKCLFLSLTHLWAVSSFWWKWCTTQIYKTILKNMKSILLLNCVTWYFKPVNTMYSKQSRDQRTIS